PTKNGRPPGGRFFRNDGSLYELRILQQARFLISETLAAPSDGTAGGRPPAPLPFAAGRWCGIVRFDPHRGSLPAPGGQRAPPPWSDRCGLPPPPSRRAAAPEWFVLRGDPVSP